jgi:hypothetical protein
MKRIKLNFAVMAFILGSAVAFTQSAFTTVKKPHIALNATQYQFNGTTLIADKSASNYSVVSGSPSCVGSSLPCTITVTGDLQTWLNAHTDTQIRDMADQKRN